MEPRNLPSFSQTLAPTNITPAVDCSRWSSCDDGVFFNSCDSACTCQNSSAIAICEDDCSNTTGVLSEMSCNNQWIELKVSGQCGSGDGPSEHYVRGVDSCLEEANMRPEVIAYSMKEFVDSEWCLLYTNQVPVEELDRNSSWDYLDKNMSCCVRNTIPADGYRCMVTTTYYIDNITYNSVSLESSSNSLELIMHLMIAGVVILAIAVIFLCWKCRRRKSQYALPGLTPVITKLSSKNVSSSRLGEEKIFDISLYKFDDFELVDLIGSGTSAMVYLMKIKVDEEWQRPEMPKLVAGKCYKSKGVLFHEAKLLGQTSANCPQLITVLGVIKQPPVLIMRYLKEGNLERVLVEELNNRRDENKPDFKPEFLWMLRMKFMLDMSKAVQHLHKNYIVHRDLAIRNLLLADDRKSVVLSDMGFSRSVPDSTSFSTTVTPGIPRNSPPETWPKDKDSKERVFSIQSDIWSLAMAMWEIANMEPITNPDKEFFSKIEKTVVPDTFIKNEKAKDDDLFGRTEELFYQMKRCWQVDPWKRPRIWEIKEKIQEFIENPVKTDDAYFEEFDDPPHVSAAAKTQRTVSPEQQSAMLLKDMTHMSAHKPNHSVQLVQSNRVLCF